MNELPFTHRIRALHHFEYLKLLADTNRLTILQHLMVEPATLSQLSKLLSTYPARLRHHVKLLEEAGLVELTSTRVGQSYVEKFYQATARAFVVNLTVLPLSLPVGAVVVWGSDDLALEKLALQLHDMDEMPDLFTLPVGSLDGLIALRQGLCQLAGCHLLDAETGEYNSGHVRHLFPGQEMLLVTLAYRQQGLMVAPDNPRNIQMLADLTREGVTFANRMRGAGTRVWLDLQLRQLGISPLEIRGYETGWKTHSQVAEAVATREADVGLGVQAAVRPFQLDFIPLFEERYDLVLPAQRVGEPLLHPLLDFLQTARFRQLVDQLDGYDSRQSGQVLKVEG